ncbi:hypothetical protein MF410_27275 (plasmid) [Rhizobium sp. C104]|uniref:hypothetical protein n=1 Tax=Rhizobium sp. C104 TaxID=2917727 RepID=UPI001EF9327F|nr:hypothetical protein [Rhizobium sp. C104]ULJ81622.1 hypothetical protein MF410_27275 [Rhizobium sp. C104]
MSSGWRESIWFLRISDSRAATEKISRGLVKVFSQTAVRRCSHSFIGCKQLAGKAILDRGFDKHDLCERVARLACLDRDVIAFLFEILHEF